MVNTECIRENLDAGVYNNELSVKEKALKYLEKVDVKNNIYEKIRIEHLKELKQLKELKEIVNWRPVTEEEKEIIQKIRSDINEYILGFKQELKDHGIQGVFFCHTDYEYEKIFVTTFIIENHNDKIKEEIYFNEFSDKFSKDFPEIPLLCVLTEKEYATSALQSHPSEFVLLNW